MIVDPAPHSRLKKLRTGFCRNGHEMTLANTYPHKDGRARCRQCGMDRRQKWRDRTKPRRVAHAKFMQDIRKLRNPLTNQRALEMVEDIIVRVEKSITQEKIEKMTPKDVAVVMAIMLDKRGDLKGLPTQRIAVEHRHRIEALMPRLLEEVERRNLVIEE